MTLILIRIFSMGDVMSRLFSVNKMPFGIVLVYMKKNSVEVTRVKSGENLNRKNIKPI